MFEALVGLIVQYKYAILVPGALFLGPSVSLVSGFFVRLGDLEIIPAYIALMAGELIGDVLWYWIGYRYGERFLKRFGRFVSITEKHVQIAQSLFRRYHTSILFISKITMGFGFAIAILFSAGLSRVPFRWYMTVNILGQFFWSAILLGAGYALGQVYVNLGGILERTILIAFGVILVGLFVGFARYAAGQVAAKNGSD